jgi:hypothetical protein
MICEGWAQSAKEGGTDNSLWQSVFSHICSTSSRYTRSGSSIELFEWDMRDLWYLFVQASMNNG